MNDSVLSNAASMSDRLVEEFNTRKQAVSEALEDGKTTVRQFVKRTRNTAEDLMDEASHNIKRAPLSSVAVAFGVGAVLGSVMGIVISRNGHR